jgi:hypothetical protein
LAVRLAQAIIASVAPWQTESKSSRAFDRRDRHEMVIAPGMKYNFNIVGSYEEDD